MAREPPTFVHFCFLSLSLSRSLALTSRGAKMICVLLSRAGRGFLLVKARRENPSVGSVAFLWASSCVRENSAPPRHTTSLTAHNTHAQYITHVYLYSLAVSLDAFNTHSLAFTLSARISNKAHHYLSAEVGAVCPYTRVIYCPRIGQCYCACCAS
jgi:hypothetical protein